MKNIRNTNKSVVNIDASATYLGPTYSTTGVIPITYDPSTLLFPSPIGSTFNCERIGDKVFIAINGFFASPTGNNILTTSVGVVPLGYRPTIAKNTICIVTNGYVDSAPLLQRLATWNTFYGVAKLDTDGTLSFGSDKPTAYGPCSQSGTLLTNFQGPNTCGLITQTLVFSLI